MGTLTTIIQAPAPGPDPSQNPNGLPLLGSHPLTSGVGLPAFELPGASFPTGEFLRFTIAPSQSDGGNAKISVGKVPDAYRETNKLGGDEVLAELEVAFQVRVTGSVPYKLFRAIVFPSAVDWREAAVSHVWFDDAAVHGGVLISDPVRGVVGSSVVTTGYNDFSNFIWEGASAGAALIADGQWHTVRVYQALNSPGNADGICRVWVDGVLDIEDTAINWVDEYDVEYGWNGFFLEAFHNGGSPTGCTIDFRDLYVRGTEAVPAELGIVTSSLPSVVEDGSYSQTLVATGGTPPYTWSVVSGALPAGLSLNASTGAITGTATGDPGASSFTVQVEDDASATDTAALSIVVTAAGSPEPVWEFDPSDYANTAALLGASGVENSSNGTNEVALVSAAGSPPLGATKLVRCIFKGGVGNETQAGITLTIPSAASLNMREFWGELEVRWQNGWVTNGPYSGNADHKTFFLFTNNESGSERWEHHVGHFGNGFGQFIAGTGNTVGDATKLWDGSWHRLQWHARMGTDPGGGGTAIWTVRYPDYPGGALTREWVGGMNATFATRYFWKLALSRNLNKGSTNDQYIEFGIVRVYDADPGWGI